MKVIGVLGLLLLLSGFLVILIGIGGAAANFIFAPEPINCQMAEEDYQKAQKLMKEYEAAKGTDDELKKKIEAEQALSNAKVSREYCGKAQESHRFYGMVFSGVGVVGFLMSIIGAIAAFAGLGKRKGTA